MHIFPSLLSILNTIPQSYAQYMCCGRCCWGSHHTRYCGRIETNSHSNRKIYCPFSIHRSSILKIAYQFSSIADGFIVESKTKGEMKEIKQATPTENDLAWHGMCTVVLLMLFAIAVIVGTSTCIVRHICVILSTNS